MRNIQDYEKIMQDALNSAHLNDLVTNPNFGVPSDWSFNVTARLSNNVLGNCVLRNRVININKNYFEQGNEEDVVRTIIHEVCHAVVGVNVSKTGRQIAHGREWKNMMRWFGYENPTAKTNFAPENEPEYLKKEKEPLYGIFYINRAKNIIERVGSCNHKLKKLCIRQIHGRPETFGRLYLVPRNAVHDESMILAHRFTTTK